MSLRKLPWVDCGAALVAGGAALALAGSPSRLYMLPRGRLAAMGAAHLGYGA